MERAYSLLTLRSVAEDRREIEGIATSPSTDRYGDIIEPLGIAFHNPLPLLLYHDTTQPVGHVTFHAPTRDGIRFTAKIAHVLEPGRLRDRVEEAWQSLKARLIRGVSIGFRPLADPEPIRGASPGLRFLKTEVLELSLVVVPANVDATITAIRSYALQPAATGAAARDVSPAPGATGSRVPRAAMQTANYSEQLTARRAELRTAHARLEHLQAQDSLTAQEQTEQDELVTQVRSLTQRIGTLDVLEAAQATLATPAADAAVAVRQTPITAVATTPSRPHISVTPPALPPGIEFARYAQVLMASRVLQRDAMVIARERFPDQPRIQMLLRAAVSGATTTDPTWAGPLTDPQNLAGEFIEYVRPQTIVGKFGTNGIPSLRNVPFNVRIVGQTSGGAAYWVGQTQPKPLTKFDYNAVTLGWAKIATIAVYSEEVARFSNPSADALVRDGLRDAVVERMDIDFIDPNKAAVANVSPASITNAQTPLTSSGSDADAVRADVQALIGAFIANGIPLTRAVWIMSSTTALALSLLRNTLGQPEFPNVTMGGGSFLGLPVIVSEYAAIGSPASNLVILVAADEVFLSDDGGVAIDASREASLEMSDNPAGETGTVVSMYQTNQIALRAERFVNWALRRAAGVQYMEGVTWGAGA